MAALAAVLVFAATADQAQPQKGWFNQMLSNHQQRVQQAVGNGTMIADQAAQINKHMHRWPRDAKNDAKWWYDGRFQKPR